MIQFTNRQSIRLKNYDYSQPGMYFVTICTQNRQCFFGNVINENMELNDTGKIIECWLTELTNKFPGIKLDISQIMPNHIHMIIRLKSLVKDPEIKQAYKNLAPEFALITNIIKKRLEKGLTQKQLAEKIGTKQSAISRLEGGRYNPTVSFLNKVARALETNIHIPLN